MTDKEMADKVLIVGAGGFVGGFIADEALHRGYEVWCGVRETTSRKYLSDKRLHFVTLDFDKPDTLAASLKAALPAGERWRYIVYNLGATKCLNYADFNRINHDCLLHFTEALKEADMVPDKFLYISSLSAMGPGDEKEYRPLRETDIPRPDTRYGTSKLKAEMTLTMSGIPAIIFRPTGIYGPRDHDYFLMFKSIKQGFDFSVGFRRQMLTFIYVEDLARAIFDALPKAEPGTYIISHPSVYSQAEFRKLAAKELGKKMVMPMRMPLFAVKAVCWAAEKIGVAQGKPSTLNTDKYRILRQRNWNADISKAKAAFGFSPRVDLAEGIRLSTAWYRQNHWL